MPPDPAPRATPSEPNKLGQTQPNGEAWPGTTVHQAMGLPQAWGDAPVPQPDSGDVLGPLSEQARARLRRQLTARADREHHPGQEHLRPMWSFLRALAKEGGTVPATRPWMPNSDTPGSPNLFDQWKSRPLGGCTNVEPYAKRWKDSFDAVTTMFRRTRAQLHVPIAFELHQSEVDPNPTPIRLRNADDVDDYLKHLEATIRHEEIEILSADQIGRHEIIIPEFFVRQNGKTRICIRGDLTKEPVKELMTKRHWKTGSQMVNHLASKDDLVMGTDQPRGYHQSEVSVKTSMRQLVLVELDLLQDALRKEGRTMPDDPRLQWHQGVLCALIRPRVLQFGDPLSAELFIRKSRHVQSENRSVLGLRIAVQMDDRSLHGRLGSASLLCDFCWMLMTDDWYGIMCHLVDKITDWPRHSQVFDGSIIVPALNMRFVPLEKDARHRAALQAAIPRLEMGVETLRTLTSITMAQASTVSASFPVRLLLGQLKTFLSAETKRINASVPAGKDPYAMLVRQPPKAVMRDLRALTAPKTMGNYMSTNFPVIAELWVDASGWAYGAKLTIFDPATGEATTRHRYRSFLREDEQEMWHTHQELFGVVNAALAALRHHGIPSGTEARPYLFRIGSDNTAALANMSRITANLTMSGPMTILIAAARLRHLIVVPLYVDKLRMDRSGCDYWGRLRSHHQQWKIDKGILEQCFLLFDIDLRTVRGIDLAACRVTRQFRQYVSRWPEPESMAYDMMTFPFLRPGTKQPLLYCYPPESMLPAVIQRIREQECEVFLVSPLTATVKAHFSEMTEMMTGYVVIPRHPDNHFPPEGYSVEGEQTSNPDQPPPWSLIFARLSLPHWRSADIKMPERARSSLSPPTMMGTVQPPSPDRGRASPFGGTASALNANQLAARLLGGRP